MLRVGIAGIGFMGWIHWLAYKKLAEVEVVAICEKAPDRLAGDWTGIKGNFGPPGEHVDLANVEVFSDLDEFAQADFDMIDICLPPSMHVDLITRAAKAGKHVFCEKPLALSVLRCREAVEICKTNDRMLMVGQVLPFFSEYDFALSTIQSDRYGAVIGCKLKRLISDPTWLPDFYDPTKIGGPLFDLHVHDAHFLRLIAGMPTSVYSRGRSKDQVVSYCESIFSFADQNMCATATSGTIAQQGRPFSHGFEIHLEDATMHFEFAALSNGEQAMPLKLIKADGPVEVITFEDSDPTTPFVNEIRNVCDSIKAGKVSDVINGDLACDAIAICAAQAKSVNENRIVRLDEDLGKGVSHG